MKRLAAYAFLLVCLLGISVEARAMRAHGSNGHDRVQYGIIGSGSRLVSSHSPGRMYWGCLILRGNNVIFST